MPFPSPLLRSPQFSGAPGCTWGHRARRHGSTDGKGGGERAAPTIGSLPASRCRAHSSPPLDWAPCAASGAMARVVIVAPPADERARGDHGSPSPVLADAMTGRSCAMPRAISSISSSRGLRRSLTNCSGARARSSPSRGTVAVGRVSSAMRPSVPSEGPIWQYPGIHGTTFSPRVTCWLKASRVRRRCHDAYLRWGMGELPRASICSTTTQLSCSVPPVAPSDQP